MTVDAISGSAAPVAGTTSSTAASPTSALGTSALASMTNGDTFLKLLVAQLKYQDPMNPTDGSAFLSQTAQMSEAANMTSLMQDEQSVLSEVGTLTSTSMIGAQVKGTQPDGSTVSGIVRSVSVDASGPVLHLDGANLPLSAVTEVDSVARAATGSATTTSTTSGSTTSTSTTAPAPAPSTTSTTPTGTA